jgi:DNA-binding transcriptional LysR family regulator
MMHVGLRYFTAVARCGSIREAAEELHVAQSALSRQIQKLEDELGVPLFQRHSRGVELTSAGEILLGYAQTSQRQVERVRSEVDALKGLRRGIVHVSAIESLVPHLLPEVIARFNRRHPGIQFDIAIEGSDRVLSAVREGRTDIGLTFHPPADPELATAFKVRAPLLAIMSSQHPLAGRPRVSMAECAAYPVALPMRNTSSGTLIDLACKAAGVHMKPVLQVNSIPLRVAFLRDGKGITFLPRLSAWDSLRTGELVGVPIRDRLVNTGTIDAVTHVSRQLPLAAEEFLRVVQGELQDLRMPAPSIAAE